MSFRSDILRIGYLLRVFVVCRFKFNRAFARNYRLSSTNSADITYIYTKKKVFRNLFETVLKHLFS